MKHINKDERTGEEIYAGIVTRIKIMYQEKITDAQSHEAARNLIGFCLLSNLDILIRFSFNP